MKSKRISMLLFVVLVILAALILGVYIMNHRHTYDDNAICRTCGEHSSLTFEFADNLTQYTVSGVHDKSIETIEIPVEYNGKPVTGISDMAFSGCNKLKNITIPHSVTTIGNGAFSDCTRLKSITIPDNVTSVGNDAFSNCKALTNVIIGDGFKSIGERAFSDCQALTNVIIGDGFKSIGDEAFRGCYSLIGITVDENNIVYKSIDGNLYTKDGKTLIQYAVGKSSASFTVPEEVTSIKEYAFQSAYALKKVIIPEGVIKIDDYAFYQCSSLTIYAEAESKLEGWEIFWNFLGGTVVWGYTGE